jgi:membrane-associated phospholipid phosphatase
MKPPPSTLPETKSDSQIHDHLLARRPFLAYLPPAFRFFLKQQQFFIGACLVLFAIAYFFVFTTEVGEAILAINGKRTEARDTFFIFFTQFAEPQAYLIWILIFCLLRYRTAIFILFAGASAGVVSGVLKGIFGHARPLRYIYDNTIEVWDSLMLFDQEVYHSSWAYTSFPSGHAMSAFALYSFIAFNANRARIPVAITCFLFASLICLSRMYLLMHFLKDVTVGATFGLLIGAALFYLQFKFFPKNTALDRGLLNQNPLVHKV